MEKSFTILSLSFLGIKVYKMSPQRHKFKEGDIVYEITRPQQLLFVTRCNGAIYYCRPVDNKKQHELAFMERDLHGEHTNHVPREEIGKIDINPS